MTRHGFRLASALERLLQRATLFRLQGLHDLDARGDLDERSHQVLACLGRLGPRTASALGVELGIDRSRVSRLADRLTAAGLVTRTSDVDDARATLLTLTGPGELLVEQRRAALARRLDVLMAAWPDGLDAAFAEGAERLVADLAPEPAPRLDPPATDGEPALDPAESRLVRSVFSIVDTTRGRVAGDVRPITGLTTADFLVLSRLQEFPDHSYSGLKALAAKLEWSASRLSHQLSRMEARGLITRERDDAPGQVRITATPDARALQEQHAALHSRAVRRHLLAHITPDEAAVFLRVADRLARSAGAASG